jgi:hypothetical protein
MNLRRAVLGLILAVAALSPGVLRALSSGADFLKVELPARPAAMAGAFAAFNDDASGFLWNPAALGALKQPQLGVTHFNSILDTSFDQASYVQPLRLWDCASGLGFSVQHSSTANFNQTDLNGNDLGAIENYDLVFGVAAGMAVTPDLRLGLGGKVFNSRLAEFKSRGFALDLGAQHQVNQRVTLGVSFVDLGTQEAYDKVADPLPTRLRLAIKATLLDSPEVLIQAGSQLERPWTTSDSITLGAGVEYWYRRVLAFRVGWKFGVDLGPFSLGLGFKFKGMSFDYAYNTLGDLGLTHRLSMGVDLGAVFAKSGWLMQALEGEDKAPDGTQRVPAPEKLR